MFKKTGVLVKAGLILGLGVATVAGAATPSFARDGGAIAAGVIGGTALGLLAGSAAAGAYAPPPPPAYYAPPAPGLLRAAAASMPLGRVCRCLRRPLRPDLRVAS